LNTDGTYAAPVKLSEGVSVQVTPNYSITTLYGDDRAVAVANALGDIDITINTTDLSVADYNLLMGTTSNTDGVIEDSAHDVAPYGALGFELPFESGGSRLYWYYKGKFQPPSTSNNTKAGSPEFQTPSVTGKFVSRDDGKWRARYDNVAETPTTVATNWFTAVYEPAVV
jgi:phi13 family phage major tail protein